MVASCRFGLPPIIATFRSRGKRRPLVCGATFRYTFASMADSVTLEALCRPILDAKGWTLEKLADKAKMSTSGLRRLMRGQVDVARGPTVNNLAKALGIEPATVRAACEASRAAAGK
jgi:DNA-binding Xre family transcriptional regulator